MTFLSVIAGLAVLGLVAQAPSAPSAGSEAEIPPSAASSQPLSPGAAAENPPADEGGRDAPRSEKKKKKSERAHAVSLEARLDVRGVQTRAEPRQLGEPTPPRAYGIGVSRAQLELGYRYQKWLGLVVQADLAALPGLRPMYEWPAEDGPEPAEGFPPEDAYARIGRFWWVGAAARLESPLGPFDARVWTDFAYGLSFQGLYGERGQDARFVAGRGLFAIRLGGREGGAPYAELFGMAEGVNFDLTAEHRTLSGYVAGINVGIWDRLRLTLEVERRDVGNYSPTLTDGGNQL